MQMYPLDPSLTEVEAGPKWLQEHSRLLKSNTIATLRATQPDRRPSTSVRNPASRPPSTMSVWPVMYLL